MYIASLFFLSSACIATHYFRALDQMSPCHHDRICPRGWIPVP